MSFRIHKNGCKKIFTSGYIRIQQRLLNVCASIYRAIYPVNNQLKKLGYIAQELPCATVLIPCIQNFNLKCEG